MASGRAEWIERNKGGMTGVATAAHGGVFACRDGAWRIMVLLGVFVKVVSSTS